MDIPFLSRRDGRPAVSVKVIPGASRDAVQAIRAGELVVKVAAAPEKGKANDELIAFFAKSSGCPRSAFWLISGQTSHHKLLSAPLEALPWLESLAGGNLGK